MIVNPTVSDFHLAFWEHIQRHHPSIIMRRPTPKGNKSNRIVMKGTIFRRAFSCISRWIKAWLSWVSLDEGSRRFLPKRAFGQTKLGQFKSEARLPWRSEFHSSTA